MSTDSVGFLVRIGDGDRGVPSEVLANTLFDVFVSREPGLFFNRDGVDIRSRYLGRCPDLEFSRTLGESGN
ncbi:unannotated protein [freshwater metagenome]|uniref:Unannotated protein n=1 Tax=freshwater metagenome TaxID=449393 RepID=A0A6J6ASW3_9ZZZZ